MNVFKKFCFIAISYFLCIMSVNAETGYTLDKTGVNMRSKPTTYENNVVATVPYKTDFYISDLNAGEGNGCSSGWYYGYYQGVYGYVCSGLVNIVGITSTTYERPWTTPKKAITGGALFIAKGYIDAGQNTSYLKKFNVNPLGLYEVYTHQYMDNLRAPAGEAVTTYNSLVENNMLNNSFNFLIPVYNNMPEKSYSYDGLYSGYEMPTADVSDETFENSISGFPDDYKPYLRAIHSKYNTWTFTPLITNLDFGETFIEEKKVCSIEKSSYKCEDQNSQTEYGWCRANDDATKYFLDPRNFLTEKYIFMFENIGFNDIYTEEVVQGVIKDSFMSGNSLLDNQSYSSIFVEAGKNAKVSPLYLASLAIQEIGTEEKTATSGKEFSYDGYTYSNLYNFFNIGAGSSEANPVLAGLVWANGGRGANNAPVSITDSNADNAYVSLLQVAKVGEYIKGYGIGTTILNIKDKVGSNATVIVKDSAGNVLSDQNIVGTGIIIEVNNGEQSMSYKLVLYGDLNGDGIIDSADLLKMRQHLLGTNILSGSNEKSADVNKDNSIDSADLLLIRKQLLGTSEIVQ